MRWNDTFASVNNPKGDSATIPPFKTLKILLISQQFRNIKQVYRPAIDEDLLEATSLKSHLFVSHPTI